MTTRSSSRCLVQLGGQTTRMEPPKGHACVGHVVHVTEPVDCGLQFSRAKKGAGRTYTGGTRRYENSQTCDHHEYPGDFG